MCLGRNEIQNFIKWWIVCIQKSWGKEWETQEVKEIWEGALVTCEWYSFFLMQLWFRILQRTSIDCPKAIASLRSFFTYIVFVDLQCAILYLRKLSNRVIKQTALNQTVNSGPLSPFDAIYFALIWTSIFVSYDNLRSGCD